MVWHGAEISVTMITIGIAVCQPVYRPWLQRFSRIRSSNGRYEEIEAAKRNQNINSNDIGRRSPNDDRFAMRTIGGTPLVYNVVADNNNNSNSRIVEITSEGNMPTPTLPPPTKYKGAVSHTGGSGREERQQQEEEEVEAHLQWPFRP